MVGWPYRFLAALMLLGALLVPQTAAAAPAVRASCFAATGLVQTVDHPRLPARADWICNGRNPQNTPQVSWVFFTPDDFANKGLKPSHFVTDIARFDRISLIVMDASGPLRSRTYSMEDVGHFVNGPKFALPLPDMQGATGLVVAIEKPWSGVIASRASLQVQQTPTDALGWSDDAMLAIALLLGMMLTPLLYHAVFHRILREGYVLWQIASATSIIALITIHSGLIHHLIGIGMETTIQLSMLALMVPMVFSSGFLLSYLEVEAIPEGMRKLLKSVVIAAGLTLTFIALPLAFLRPLTAIAFLLIPIPLAAVAIASAAMAIRSGRRIAWAQLCSWAALSLAYLFNAVRGFGLVMGDGWVDVGFVGAITLHVAVGVFAVLYRVDIMRKERERVNARLDALTNLIDLDPLTGIFNRRAFEQRFVELRSDGFHALAVVDLDHFKRINDKFGHATGDRVLQEVAAVLAGDKDAIGFRMGGEEFVVMMRGSQIQQRAEQLRRAITIRIANEVEGIDAPVTASMGLIESPPGGASSMRQLYSHADRLLYEAKYSGRNRLISERIQIFEPPSRERRMKDRRNADRRAEG
ncbi:diguanylate cyclase [Croceicoccus gelatinilyticus]|uniref:sensor domain-containing diguanylate cyclase n=1 Tax=Croceicoccus gelatinilyticus TaxID=2835536 RepID=UPI001BCEE26B|nr:diguanylate cyclase [Croceicoccus gelatinilyticus]MBS7669735.1 diguanylate cyclase [Croceicoccus gelatinilyticus]